MAGRAVRAVSRTHNAIVDVMAAIAMASLAAMAVMVAAHVVMRATIGAGVRGVNELSQYLLVALVYAGLAAALRDGSFIRVHLLIGQLGTRVQSWMIRLVAVVSLGFMGVLTWRSSAFAFESWRRGTESIGVLEAPLWIPQSIVAIGSVALTVQLVAILINPVNHLVGKGVVADESPGTIRTDKWHPS